ncbi:MAG: hypothetical protein ACKVX7_17370 [Planctomycetota bacterium]
MSRPERGSDRTDGSRDMERGVLPVVHAPAARRSDRNVSRPVAPQVAESEFEQDEFGREFAGGFAEKHVAEKAPSRDAGSSRLDKSSSGAPSVGRDRPAEATTRARGAAPAGSAAGSPAAASAGSRGAVPAAPEVGGRGVSAEADQHIDQRPTRRRLSDHDWLLKTDGVDATRAKSDEKSFGARAGSDRAVPDDRRTESRSRSEAGAAATPSGPNRASDRAAGSSRSTHKHAQPEDGWPDANAAPPPPRPATVPGYSSQAARVRTAARDLAASHNIVDDFFSEDSRDASSSATTVRTPIDRKDSKPHGAPHEKSSRSSEPAPRDEADLIPVVVVDSSATGSDDQESLEHDADKPKPGRRPRGRRARGGAAEKIGPDRTDEVAVAGTPIHEAKVSSRAGRGTSTVVDDDEQEPAATAANRPEAIDAEESGRGEKRVTGLLRVWHSLPEKPANEYGLAYDPLGKEYYCHQRSFADREELAALRKYVAQSYTGLPDVFINLEASFREARKRRASDRASAADVRILREHLGL